MPTIEFSERLVFDSHFFNDILSGKFKDQKPPMLRQLMTINDKAKGRSRCNNVMSKKCFETTIIETGWERAVLRALFFPYDDPDLEKIEDEIERNIKIAIDLLDEPPNSTLIFTSEEKQEEYMKNPHFNGVKEIKIKSGKEAITIISDYFHKCTPN